MAESLNFEMDPEGIVFRYLENPRPDLKDLILVQYAPMVERVARKFAGIEPLDDLVQVGFIGLLNALSKFDPEAGVRFNTYATYLVAGEIKHYLRDKAQTIRQPAWLQELRHKVNRATAVLQSELGREPSEAEIASHLDVAEHTVHEVFQTSEMIRVGSLDSLTGDDESDAEVDRLDASDYCPEQLSVEERVVLESAMKQLRDLEREVLVLFHFESLNQTEIAAKLGISCNYVSHILRQSLSKLRRILSREEENDRILKRQAESLDFDVIDATTGVYTEAYFRTRLEEELHRASGQSGAVALVTVRFEGLAHLASFYGQTSVDDFLADAADFLKDTVRRLDVVCRLGDAGFAVLLPSTANTASLARQRILSRIVAWIASRQVDQQDVKAVLGSSSFPVDGKRATTILEKALRPVDIEAAGFKAA